MGHSTGSVRPSGSIVRCPGRPIVRPSGSVNTGPSSVVTGLGQLGWLAWVIGWSITGPLAFCHYCPPTGSVRHFNGSLVRLSTLVRPGSACLGLGWAGSGSVNVRPATGSVWGQSGHWPSVWVINWVNNQLLGSVHWSLSLSLSVVRPGFQFPHQSLSSINFTTGPGSGSLGHCLNWLTLVNTGSPGLLSNNWVPPGLTMVGSLTNWVVCQYWVSPSNYCLSAVWVNCLPGSGWVSSTGSLSQLGWVIVNNYWVTIAWVTITVWVIVVQYCLSSINNTINIVNTGFTNWVNWVWVRRLGWVTVWARPLAHNWVQ